MAKAADGLRGAGKAVLLVEARLAPGARSRFEMASDTEQHYMAAMASLGAPPYSTAEVARAWGAENQRQTSPHRDSLLQKGLIWSPGEVRSTSRS